MAGTENFSDAKRRLLERMLRGEATRQSFEAPLDQRRPGDPIPIAPSQQQIWLHSQMAPDVPLYNEPVTLHFRGSLDHAIFERSFHELLRRHEIWRTTFAQVDGQVVQAVHADMTIPVPLTDLTDLPETQRNPAALQIATADAQRPFDLGVGPLLRTRLVKLAEDSYRFYITAHHIVFEGRGVFEVVLKELPAIYDAFSKGLPSPLPEPQYQYADYAIWQKRLLDNDSAARQLNYWRYTLSGELPALELPLDRPRPLTLSYSGAMEMFSLGAELSANIKATAQAEGVTLYMLMLAAFKTLLHRYSGQEDILVGGVTDSRRRPEFDDLLGFFLHTVALRSRPTSRLKFREYLGQVKDTVLGAMSAGDVPFDHVIREVLPKRDLGRHALLQAVFSMEPPSSSPDPRWDMTHMDISTGASKFDLYLGLEDRSDGIAGRIIYNTGIFDAATVRRLRSHLITLLEGIARDPGTTLALLPVLPEPELRLVSETWNDTARPVPATTIQELFEKQVARTPFAAAVEHEIHSLTYAELNQEANRLARRLRKAGAGPETIVGLCLDRGCEMVVAMLAILKSGAAYLPLDTAFPEQRLRTILEDAGASLILTERWRGERLATLPGERVFLDEGIGSGENIEPQAGPQNLAYVLYTSGSTGSPKGVEIEMASLVNLILAASDIHAVTPADRLLAVTTLSFDPATMEVLLPLVNGATVIVAGHEDTRDPVRLCELMRRTSPSIMNATPATWRALIDAGWTGDPKLRIICGGSAMPPELARQLLALGAGLWNGYGPTETAIASAFHRVTAECGQVPIGGPIANTRFRILDANRQLVPVGVAGELYIGGAGLARGYVGRDDLTRERFIELPGQGRFYRTGDLARWRPGGVVECLGRIDNQVKIRGFRIEIEEIEAALLEHREIRAAAVKAWPDVSGQLSLTAYVVSATRPNLRAFLSQKLPDYMIPARTVWLDALPATPNGKVDLRRLLPPDAEEQRSAPLPPSNEIERKLVQVWESVLDRKSIGIQDNFFDLGGHSLLVAKLLRRVEAEFGARLSMAAVFQAPTVWQFAQLMGSQDVALRSPKVAVIQSTGSRSPLFWMNAGPRYRALTARLGKDRPFLGVSLDPAEEAALPKVVSLQEFAACIVRKIRAIRPHGPYLLGGLCVSGLLAYEVAAQLAAAGEEVSQVVMLDALNLREFIARAGHRLLGSRIRFHWKKLTTGPLKGRWHYVRERYQYRVRRGASLALWSEQLYRAALQYEPCAYDGRVMMLEPAERLDIASLADSWAGVAQARRDIQSIPGNHDNLLEEPMVGVLAARILHAIDEAEASREQRLPVTAASGTKLRTRAR